MGIFRFFGLGLFFSCAIFLVAAFFPGTDRKEADEEEEIVLEKPFEFRAAEKDAVEPTLTFKVSEHWLEISPLVHCHYTYEVGRLVYFGDEEDPIGFELCLTDADGKEHHDIIHRGRPKFHTAWKYKVRYGEKGTYEDMKEIAKSAGYNIMCIDCAE